MQIDSNILDFSRQADDTAQAWLAYQTILRCELSELECVGVAYAALMRLPAEHAETVMRAVAEQSGAGTPIAPLFSHMDEAAFWADMAEPAELDAYCLASFNRMHPARQSAFLGFVQGRAAA